jgi:hypothetical protein
MELFGYTFGPAVEETCVSEQQWIHESVNLGYEVFINKLNLECLECTLKALIKYIDLLALTRGGSNFIHLSMIMVVLESFVFMWMVHMIVFFAKEILQYLIEIVKLPFSLFLVWLEICKTLLNLARTFQNWLWLNLSVLMYVDIEDSRPLIPRPSQRWKSPIVELYNPTVTPSCPICHDSYASLEWNVSCFANCGHTFCTRCLTGTKKCSMCGQEGRYTKIFLRQ